MGEEKVYLEKGADILYEEQRCEGQERECSAASLWQMLDVS